MKPVEKDLASIDAVKDKAGLIKTMGTLERDGLAGLFSSFVNTDAKKSDRYIVYLNQSGLGLPDESYYRDPKFQKIRDAYVAHIAKMFALAKLADPEKSAARVMALVQPAELSSQEEEGVI